MEIKIKIKTMKRTSLLLIVGILVFALTSAYTGYLYWQKASSQVELEKVSKSLSEYESKVAQYQNLQILQAINAEKAISALEENIIEWSKVIKKIRKTVPTTNGDLSLVDILSYSGSSNNEISMNVKTYADSDEPYFDVADLIEAFDESSSFADSFVPSISSGVDQEGKALLTFLLSTKYVEEEVFGGSEIEVEVEPEVEAEVPDSSSVVR
jgi:hypothetical protein